MVSEIFQKDHFVTVKSFDGSGGINAIFSRPEVSDEAISGEVVGTFQYYACVNLWFVIFSSFREKLKISHLYNA